MVSFGHCSHSLTPDCWECLGKWRLQRAHRALGVNLGRRDAPMTAAQPADVRCPKCKQPTRLVERLWRLETSSYVRVFKCQCGDWDD